MWSEPSRRISTSSWPRISCISSSASRRVYCLFCRRVDSRRAAVCVRYESLVSMASEMERVMKRMSFDENRWSVR